MIPQMIEADCDENAAFAMLLTTATEEDHQIVYERLCDSFVMCCDQEDLEQDLVEAMEHAASENKNCVEFRDREAGERWFVPADNICDALQRVTQAIRGIR